MSAFKMKNKGGAAQDAPAVGTHLARLVGIVDLDHQPGFEWQGEEIESQYKVTFTYELVNSLREDGKPHWVSEDFKVSDHERSKMYARTRGLDPTGDLSNNGQDIFGLINTACMVSVSQNAKGYPKIDSVSGAPAGIPVPDLQNEPVTFSFDEPDMEVFKRLPEFVQKKLKSSLNFNGSALDAALVDQGDTNDSGY